MATLSESATWVAGIYQLETTDPVLGGPDGIDNLQAKQLANRTLWLKNQVESLGNGKQPLDATLTALAGITTEADRLIYSTGIDSFAVTPLTAFIRTLLDDASATAARNTLGAASVASPAFTGEPTAPTAVPGTNTQQLATTAFVQAATATQTEKVSKTGDTMSGTLTLYNGTDSAPQLRWNNTLWNTYIDLVQNQIRFIADQSGAPIFPLIFDLSAKSAYVFGNAFWHSGNFDPAAKANKATSVAGYGITDAYTKSEVNNSLGGKADKATSLAGYGIADAYTKGEANALLNAKLPTGGGALSGDLTLTNGTATSPKIRWNNTTWNAYLDISGSQLRLYSDNGGAVSYPLVWNLNDLTMYAWGNQVWTNANRPKNTASLAVNGWWKDSDTGRIEVWGQATLTVANAVGSVADLAIPFPMSFPTEVHSLTFASVAGNATEVVENVVGFYNLTTGGVVISAKRVAGTQTGGETIVVHYRATGR
ncbi:hypothetical protein N5J43_00900 [Pseudomonas nicosulfuronedens]|uniref:gp53-like domain-containing protein n=1 Tax=Pseudomonas nicosulfuronedens TaxID=2571105 RepID=UPI002446865E|nr:hypothetical protein [Pseudomonas nicosulfuronedens]MDH1007439.1 hypothetical protein [Pseudomonas nicosulfuronedens]MDH1977485.1 hypothetical protein [Pseudomonas nicosulfuronedens]MDH2028989.1 hypothetical protein [Pseudomonas nicosulfuronedens]